MATTIDIQAVLEAAIRREEEAHGFYSGVAERSRNAAVKETFAQLAKEELGHKVFLQNCQKDPDLLGKLPTPADYKVAETTPEPELSVDMKPADALALAMKKEEQAARFYEDLAATSADPQLKAMFENLARMELGHKTGLEALFVDIGYPEAW